MAVSWRIEDRYVLVESDESGTLAEWKLAVDSAIADPAFRPGMAILHDLRRRTSVPDTFEVNDRVAFLLSRGRSAGIQRWAVVVSGAAQYGMARMAQILGDLEGGARPALCIFKDLAEAEAWVREPGKSNGIA